MPPLRLVVLLDRVQVLWVRAMSTVELRRVPNLGTKSFDGEFSQPFLQGMLNRMAVSWAKYGNVSDAAERGVDFIASLKARLDLYESDGNTEWLMDVANFAMIEFMHPRHPEAHFKATSADESPGRVMGDGTANAQRNERLGR